MLDAEPLDLIPQVLENAVLSNGAVGRIPPNHGEGVQPSPQADEKPSVISQLGSISFGSVPPIDFGADIVFGGFAHPTDLDVVKIPHGVGNVEIPHFTGEMSGDKVEESEASIAIRETEQTPNGGPTEPTPNISIVCVCDTVQVTNHRSVRKGKRVTFIQLLVAECKVRFGTPADTMANRRSIQRFVVQILNTHGVRAAHARTILPTVVELVLTPDKWEQDAAKLADSRFIRTRRGKSISLYQKFLNWWDGDESLPPIVEG